MKKHWLIGGLAGVFALAGLAFVQGGGAEGEAATAAASGQPIAFTHSQHAGSEAGQNNMNCQFCHFSAERSVDAGIPPVSTCWGCHQIVQGTTALQQQEIAKISGYVERNEPIPWVRMYKISDHAHFPHMRHVTAASLQPEDPAEPVCQQCHGEIQTMTEITTRRGVARSFLGADPVWGGDNMGWCVECHRQPNPATGVQQASTDCAVCHY